MRAVEQAVARLHAVLGQETIVASNDGYALVDAAVDALDFEELLGEARLSLREGDAGAGAESVALMSPDGCDAFQRGAAGEGCRRFGLRARMGVLGINHLAFRTVDPDLLWDFYLELTGAEELEGEHRPLRLGQTLLAFFPSKSPGAAADPDEIAFDVDGPGFADVLERARGLGCQIRGPLEHTPSSRGFYLSDPDGRRLEFTHDDRGVYWRE